MASPSGARGAIAPEHSRRLLKTMSSDGEYLTSNDLLQFVRKRELPFQEELLLAMFEEANSNGTGLIDAEQLGKAVSQKFAFRQHTADWERLFEAALPLDRLRALSPRVLEQEPILANFEQEPNILTFWPVTNAGAAGEAAAADGGPQSPGGLSAMRMLTGSVASFNSSGYGGRRTVSSGAVFNPPPLPSQPATLAAKAEREEEDKINRRLRPPLSASPPATASASAPPATAGSTGGMHLPTLHLGDADAPAPGVQMAYFDQRRPREEEAPARCGFDACAAFDMQVETLSRTSAGHGWRTRGAEEVRRRMTAPPPPRFSSLHEKDFLYVPGGSADHIPLRSEGVVRGDTTGVSLRLLSTENSMHGLANSRAHAKAEFAARADGSDGEPFVSVFPNASKRTFAIKSSAAADRLEAGRGVEPPAAISFMNGKPDPYEFRALKPDVSKLPPGAPDFVIARLGRHWPVKEGLPPSELRKANPPNTCLPMRLMLTENAHPAARSTRSILKS